MFVCQLTAKFPVPKKSNGSSICMLQTDGQTDGGQCLMPHSYWAGVLALMVVVP